MELGDRMKDYENRFRYKLNRRTPTILRIDGRAFHTFTRGMNRPFDYDLINLMTQTTEYLCKNMDNCVLAYTQSDEISLLLIDFKTHDTQSWFDYNLQKITSLSSSMTTGFFNLYGFPKWNKIANFDSRAFQIADPDEVANYFLWRNRDWSRNSVSMLARSLYPHKELHKKNVPEMHEMCYAKGINWADLPDSAKNGTWLRKIDRSWAQVTSQWDNSEYIRKLAEYSNYE
jgi:tRNA(His) guanylyltransferase